MRWLTFILLSVVVLVLQAAVAPRLAVAAVRPDWLLVLVVFFAMHARARDAVLGAWFIGIAADLMTLERLGLFALSYSLVAMFVCSFREFVFKDRRSAQIAVTLAASVLVRAGWACYRHWLYPSLDESVWACVTEVVVGSIYTAAWVPLVHPLLLKKSRFFGLAVPRYTYAGSREVTGSRV